MESGRDVGEVKPQKGKCICAWRNCDDIKKQFCANLPDNHVWNGPLIQVKKGLNAEEKKSPRGMSSMFKNMAFRAGIHLTIAKQSICSHLKLCLMTLLSKSSMSLDGKK